MATTSDVDHPLNTTRLDFLSHSNCPPTEHESTHILQLITEEESRLVELDRELAPVRALLERLERKRSEYTSDLRKHKSIVGPIRRVPPEIVREIFLLVLDLDLDFELECRRFDSPSECLSHNKAPLLLGQICSTWRQICIEFPRLWNRMIISFSDESHHRMINLVKIWLDRAQALPLSLVIRPGNRIEVDHLSKMMDVLLPYLSHCKRLCIDLVDGFIPYFEKLNYSMPVLDHLDVKLKMNPMKMHHGLVRARVLRAFENAVHLKSVKISANFLIGQTEIEMLNVPWSQLTQLTISDLEFYPDIFLRHSYLEQLILNVSDSGRPFTFDPPHALLPRLRDLHLSTKDSMFIASDVLDTLTLPALRTLYFSDVANRDFPIDNFVALQARSHFELTSLSLTALSLQSLNPGNLFRTIPSLVSLSLGYCMCPPKVLEALTYTERDSDPLLPCLQELTIMDEGDDDIFQIKHVLDMVESRWWPDTHSSPDRSVARLVKVSIEVLGSPPSASVYERMEKLQKEGLKASWWL